MPCEAMAHSTKYIRTEWCVHTLYNMMLLAMETTVHVTLVITKPYITFNWPLKNTHEMELLHKEDMEVSSNPIFITLTHLPVTYTPLLCTSSAVAVRFWTLVWMWTFLNLTDIWFKVLAPAWTEHGVQSVVQADMYFTEPVQTGSNDCESMQNFDLTLCISLTFWVNICNQMKGTLAFPGTEISRPGWEWGI